MSALTQASDPDAWAATQNNLGLVLSRQLQHDNTGTLTRAVRAFDAALTVYTRTTYPYAWATTRINLGSTYVALGQRGASGALERAIGSYASALTVLTAHDHPSAWGTAQIGLGAALMEQAEFAQDLRTLEHAVRAFEAALTVLTPNSDPNAWAMAQGNLGKARFTMGALGVPGALERAVIAYDAALIVYTPQNFSAHRWAAMQLLLGHALLRIGDSAALARAEAAFEAALTVRTRTTDLSGWAEATYALSFVYRGQGRFSQARATARSALSAYQQVGETVAAEHVRSFIAELDAPRR